MTITEMNIAIAAREDAPQTRLYTKIIKHSNTQQWDRDVMFLIPGGPGGNHTLYADIEEALLQYADLVIIDLRGCGYSEEADVQVCTLEHHVRDIEAVRLYLNIPEPIIHGCSYGAMVALGFAIRFPNNLSKLILSSGAASGDFVKSAKANLEQKGTSEQIEMAKILWEGRFEGPEQFAEYYKLLAPLYVYYLPSPEELPTLKNSIPYNIELVNYAFKNFLIKFDYRNQLKEVIVPVLIFSGKNDWITDTNQAKILQTGISQSILIVLEKCGHFPWKDQADLFLTNISHFLQNTLTHNDENQIDSYQDEVCCSPRP